MVASAQPSEFDLFLRLWDQPKLTPPVAKQLLKLQFEEGDRLRITELTAKNRAGEIEPDELEELDK